MISHEILVAMTFATYAVAIIVIASIALFNTRKV